MPTPLDRLVRKEVALGTIREMLPPDTHMGLTIAPFMEVATDDVIFQYLKDTAQEGLAPARAEDAEAELSQKDDYSFGEGRASIIDWALKDKYTASDVTRYREDLLIQQRLAGIQSQLPLNFAGRAVADFQARVARDDAARRRRLDNRIEWMIMQAVETGGIAYNDGKIKFAVNFGRPTDQNNIAPASGLWNTTTFDPIGDVIKVLDLIETRTGVRPRRVVASRRIVNAMWKSNLFLAAVGMPVIGGTPNVPLDTRYLGLSGYNPEGAQRIVEQATDTQWEVYEGGYRTRPVGSTTTTFNRFLPDNKLQFMPFEADLGEIDDTQIGFAKTLTAPHPEGNWASGFYEWEQPELMDPWMHVRGTGIKAFPIFPYMEMTANMTVL